MKHVLLLILCLGGLDAAAQVSPAAVAPTPLSIGETFTVRSEALGETRRINVYAPGVYHESDSLRLPVLYMPDGGLAEDFLHIAGLLQISSLNGTMRPFLLVGIENTERRRDLTGPTEIASDLEIAPRVGGSASFRAFIRDELMPVVRQAYRTTGETAIIGESLAGLFAVETLLLEPDLFDVYIAIDPSLWWNGGRLVKEAATLIKPAHGTEKMLFLASSSQPEIAELTGRLANAVGDSAVEGVRVRHIRLADEHHHTIYHPAALLAFRTVLAPDRVE